MTGIYNQNSIDNKNPEQEISYSQAFYDQPHKNNHLKVFKVAKEDDQD